MIARNLSKNYVTRIASKQPLYSDEEVYNTKDPSSNHVMLYDIHDYLSEMQAEIVILKIVHKLKFREIGEFLNLSIGKVQSEYYEAIKTLRKELN